MAEIFEAVLEMSIKACFVIIVIMIARLILARAPKKHSYLLWIAAAFRLCVPFSVGTSMSIFGISRLFGEQGGQTVITDPIPNNITVPDGVIDTGTGDIITGTVGSAASAGMGISVMQILAIVWLCGAIAMLVYGILSFIIVYRRMSTATRYEKNVFCSENVLSPFTLGFIKPRIYIPYGLDGITREKVIAHERCHINRFDHIIKPFAFILLAFHWFNPLCWLAFNRMSLDMEMSCDEKLLRTQGDEEMKKVYTKALLSFASNRRFPSPGPVNFNESGNAKKRISNSLNYKKPRVWVSVLAYLFCAVMLVACATDASGTSYTDINKTVFADAPYVVTYENNGDGTCTVTDVIVDYSANGKITVVIPEYSPDGDKVTKVALDDFHTFASLNVPVLVTEQSFDKIKASLEESGLDEREIRRFVSFYDPHEQDGILVLEPAINEEEYERLSDILEKAGYTSQNAYDAAVEVVNTVPASSDEATELRLQAFGYFYHASNKIKCIIVPEEAVVSATGNVAVTTDDGSQPNTNTKKTELSVKNSDIGNALLFFTDQTVKNFSVHTISVADYNDESGFSYQIDETVATYNFAWENSPLEVHIDYSVSDEFAVSFTEVDGTTRYFRIYQSEEDGSYFLIELDIQ